MQFSVTDACSMILISGAPDSLEQHSLLFDGKVNEVKVDDEKLKAVLKFCY